MFPCSICDRHLRENESRCPFCGAVQRSQSAPRSTLGGVALAAIAALGSASCASRSTGVDEDTTTTTTESDGSSEWSTSLDPTSDATTSSDTTTTGWTTNSIPDRDFAAYGSACDPAVQDCPEGEKCVPYAATGELWSAPKCVPVSGDGQPGEICSYEDRIVATDDCDETSACWFIEEVDGALQGVCTPFCSATFNEPEPTCGPGEVCYQDYDGSVAFCLPACDPLLQDCPLGQLCTWGHTAFACVYEHPTPALSGEPCAADDVRSCSTGDVCVPAASLQVCDGESCCTPYCDVGDPMATCPSPELACAAFFQLPPPPGWEDVGVCITPP